MDYGFPRPTSHLQASVMMLICLQHNEFLGSHCKFAIKLNNFQLKNTNLNLIINTKVDDKNPIAISLSRFIFLLQRHDTKNLMRLAELRTTIKYRHLYMGHS